MFLCLLFPGHQTPESEEDIILPSLPAAQRLEEDDLIILAHNPLGSAPQPPVGDDACAPKFRPKHKLLHGRKRTTKSHSPP